MSVSFKQSLKVHQRLLIIAMILHIVGVVTVLWLAFKVTLS